MFGGVMVLRTGLLHLLRSSRLLLSLLGALAVFSFFYFLIFKRLADHHLARIRNYPENRMQLRQVFDLRTYLIILLMSGGASTLRLFDVLPDFFIAFFYPGLGTALALRGLLYLISGLRS